MAITAGQKGRASDFIDSTTADPQGVNNAGKVPRLEADGKIAGMFVDTGTIELTAGETINGVGSPKAVFQYENDGRVYMCSTNDFSDFGWFKLKFIGFAISNSVLGLPITVKVSGILDGFTGLTPQRPYFLSGSGGGISYQPVVHTITAGILVGHALTDTALLIQRGSRFAMDTASQSATGQGTVVTCGFRALAIKGTAEVNIQTGPNSINNIRQYDWTWLGDAGGSSTTLGISRSFLLDGTAGRNQSQGATGILDLGSQIYSISIVNVGDIGFTILGSGTSSAGGTVRIGWQAWGEM